MKTAVLIPCFNEETTIGKVVRDFKNQLPDAEIWVYDNNSTDGTVREARENGALIGHEPRQGKGNVIQSMFLDIDADIYVMVDGDDTYPAGSVRELIDPIVKGEADMVMGDRLSFDYFNVNTRPFHNGGNRLVRYLINKLFNGSLNDILTGYRAFSRDFVENFPLTSGGFELETEMTIHALDKSLKIKEIPIKYSDRPEGSTSKLNTFIDGAKVIRSIILLFRDYRPLRFFTIISGFLTLLAIGFLIPVLLDYHRTGLVERFPTLIVCSLVILLAIVLFCIGIMLEVSARRNRQTFAHLRLLSRRIQSWKNLNTTGSN